MKMLEYDFMFASFSSTSQVTRMRYEIAECRLFYDQELSLSMAIRTLQLTKYTF
jgi:hypothetical protein